jgi:hypothetical protein
MPTRRNFVLSASTAAALPVLAAGLSVSNMTHASSTPISDTELTRQMTGKLDIELNDPATAHIEVPRLEDIFFTWSLPSIPADRVRTIVAYSFGSRKPSADINASVSETIPSALPVPGPVNEKIADAVYSLYRLAPVMVFAQREVASILASRYGMNDSNLRVVPTPAVVNDGTTASLTIAQVAAATIALNGSAVAMGTTAIVTHRDQAKSAIETSRALGMAAYAAQEIVLPVDYDPQALQPANRRRDLYLLGNMSGQFASLRANLIAQAYPNG